VFLTVSHLFVSIAFHTFTHVNKYCQMVSVMMHAQQRNMFVDPLLLGNPNRHRSSFVTAIDKTRVELAKTTRRFENAASFMQWGHGKEKEAFLKLDRNGENVRNQHAPKAGTERERLRGKTSKRTFQLIKAASAHELMLCGDITFDDEGGARSAQAAARDPGGHHHFTCFTGTKVQLLTQKVLQPGVGTRTCRTCATAAAATSAVWMSYLRLVRSGVSASYMQPHCILPSKRRALCGHTTSERPAAATHGTAAGKG
jgi:hypothetical protein